MSLSEVCVTDKKKSFPKRPLCVFNRAEAKLPSLMMAGWKKSKSNLKQRNWIKQKHRHRRNVMRYRFTSLLFVSRHFFLFLVISFCFTSFLFVSRHLFLFHTISLRCLFVFISYNFVCNSCECCPVSHIFIVTYNQHLATK